MLKFDEIYSNDEWLPDCRGKHAEDLCKGFAADLERKAGTIADRITAVDSP